MERLYAPWRMAYVDQPAPPGTPADAGTCVFCAKAASGDDDKKMLVFRGASVFVLMNVFPYNNGHVMVVPYTHTASLADLDEPALLEMMTAARQAQAALQAAFHPDGYNLGMNIGTAGGAGIADHLHLHVVPRWNGDTNFMPVLGDVKVLPDSLVRSAHVLREAWPASPDASRKTDNDE